MENDPSDPYGLEKQGLYTKTIYTITDCGGKQHV